MDSARSCRRWRHVSCDAQSRKWLQRFGGGHTSGPALSNAGDFASGPPARGHNNLPPGLVGGSKRVDGSVVMPVEDPNTTP